MADETEAHKPENTEGIRDELRPELPVEYWSRNDEGIEDPQQVYQEALAEFGIFGVELAEALREEAISRAEVLNPKIEDSEGDSADEETDSGDDFVRPDSLDYWLFTHGLLNLLPYIFHKYRSSDVSSDIYDGRANIDAYLGYLAERYDISPEFPAPDVGPPGGE